MSREGREGREGREVSSIIIQLRNREKSGIKRNLETWVHKVEEKKEKLRKEFHDNVLYDNYDDALDNLDKLANLNCVESLSFLARLSRPKNTFQLEPKGLIYLFGSIFTEFKELYSLSKQDLEKSINYYRKVIAYFDPKQANAGG